PGSSGRGLPRMRGDRPCRGGWRREGMWVTPHARGSTQIPYRFMVPVYGYPACAGIDLSVGVYPASSNGLPRMRGDRPYWAASVWVSPRVTPHARGSTPGQNEIRFSLHGYPACAGIDPQNPPQD